MDLIPDTAMTHPENQPCSILIAAGESSGEAHAAGLIKQLRSEIEPTPLELFGSGGEQMAAQGVELLLDVSDLAAIGPWAALGKLRNYLWLYRELVRQARTRAPSLAILVDFPEFNLRLAARLKKMGIPICYFISPQVWAWRSSRVKQIKRYVDLMLVILPFEEEFFRDRGIVAHYVGNPSASRLRRLTPASGTVRKDDQSGSKMVAMLPGSREKEVEQILPILLDAALFVQERVPTRFSLVKAPAVKRKQIEGIYQKWSKRNEVTLDLEICESVGNQILQEADCAIVKSGTSTLEAMLVETPFAMVYRISYLSWFLLRPLVDTDTYCLANLIAGNRIVPEFVQKNATGERIGAYILTLLTDPRKRNEHQILLSRACDRLGSKDAYEEGARKIVGRFF